MNNFKIWSSLLFCIVTFYSCNLDRFPSDKINPKTFFETDKELNLYTLSFYEMLPTGEDIYKKDGELSDYFATSSSPNSFINGNYTANDASGWDWHDLYNINYFLQHADNSNIPSDKRNHYLGLAHFFRAWFYFEKVKRFGDVPWYDTTLELDDPSLYKARDSRSVVMQHVLDDLNFACKNISVMQDNTASTINKWVALGFKSRVCLFEGTFRKYHPEFNLQDSADYWLSEARDAARQVIESGVYKLNTVGSTPYRDLFTSQAPVTTEIMLADNYSGEMSRYNDANWAWTSPSYWVRPGLTRKFINTFLCKDGMRFTDKANYNSINFEEEVKGRDERLSQIIRTAGYRLNNVLTAPDLGYTKTGYQVIKFTQDNNTNMVQAKNTNTIPIMRYAEILLNYAEADRELGQFTAKDWDMTIAPLRKRAGIENIAMPVEADRYLETEYYPDIKDAVLLEIRRERSIELCSEGFRFDDIRRWKEGHLMEDVWDGIYVSNLNEEFDLNEDGQPDVCFVKQMPENPISGIVYFVLSSSISLSHGTYGNILVYPNIKKHFENKKYLYPIPESDLLINPALKQNKGWEL